MTIEVSDTYEYESETPRPVDADSVARGAFAHLEEGQGAVQASRHPSGDAHHGDNKPEEMDKRTLALIVSGMAVALILVLAFVIGTLAAPSKDTDGAQTVEQVAVAADQSVTLHGYSYQIQKQDEVYQLVEVSQTSGSEPVSLGELQGTPAGLVLYDGAIIIPQNLKDGTWDIMAYTIGSGWSQLMDQKGNATSGKGEVMEVTLEGTTLVLGTDSGRVEVPLVW